MEKEVEDEGSGRTYRKRRSPRPKAKRKKLAENNANF